MNEFVPKVSGFTVRCSEQFLSLILESKERKKEIRRYGKEKAMFPSMHTSI
jgi:hypothetical protein